jgi:ABC-type transport system involved in multi-copper enzyme maturation permease subunit
LIELRLISVLAVVLLLFGLSSVLNKQDYHGEQVALSTEEARHHSTVFTARQYSQLILKMFREPSPLSVLASGVGNRYGDIALVGGRFSVDIPEPNTQKLLTFAKINPLIGLLKRLDFSGVVLIFLSLLGGLLSYDAISGERERGMLKLCLAHDIPRYQLLLGEYLGALVTLLLPITLALVIWLLVIRLPTPITLQSSDYARLVVITIFTGLFLSAFVFLGLWMSALTHSSATSLVMLLSLWSFMVIVYPNCASIAAIRLVPLRPLNSTSLAPAYDPRLEEMAWRRQVEQARFAETLKLPMLTTSYTQAVEILAQTDVGSHIRFIEQAQQINSKLRQWQEEKIRRYPGRDIGYNAEWGPLDVSDLPAAEYEAESLGPSLRRVFPNLLVLMIWNSLCLIGALRSLVAYNPA